MATRTCNLCNRPIPEGHNSCPFCVTTRMAPEEIEGFDGVEIVAEAVDEDDSHQDKLGATAEFIAEEVVDEPPPADPGKLTGRPSLKQTQAAMPPIGMESLGEIDLGQRPTDPNSPPTDLHLVSDALEPPRPGQDDEGISAEVVDDGLALDVVEEVESGSSVNLTEPEKGGRDLIAEQVESGVDLTGTGSRSPASAGDEIDESAVDLGSPGVIEAPSAAAQESSAVDLGSSEVIEIPEDVVAEVEGKKAKADAPLKLQSMQEPEPDEVEDLGDVGQTLHRINPHQTVDLPRTGMPTQAVIGGHTEMMGEEDLFADMLHGSGPQGALDDDADTGTVDEGSGDEVIAEDEPAGRTVRTAPEPPEEEDLEPEPPADEAPEEEEEAEAPAVAEKTTRRRNFVPWVGGALVGGVVVAALAGGAWMAGLLGSKDNGSANKTTTTNPKPANDPRIGQIAEKLKEAKIENADVVAGVSELVEANQKVEKELAETRKSGGGSADPITWLTGGDFDRALPALEKLDAGKVENQVAQGKALWWRYVRDQSKAGQPFDRKAPQVQKAIELLDKASKQGNADALFWLGKIEEDTGNAATARQIYQRGLSTDLKPLFQAQLDRMEQIEGTQSLAPRPETDDRALVAAVLLSTFLQPPDAKQQPEAKQAPPKADEPEAAPSFFRAIRLAREGNYADAVKEIKEARKIYNETRYDRLLKAQNPKTDPDNKLFASTCDELQMYFEVLAALKAAGVDTVKQRNPAKAVAALGTELEQARKDSAAIKALAAKFREAKYEDPDLAKDFDVMLAQLMEARQRADTQARQLAEAKKTLETQSAQLKAVADNLRAAGYRGNDLVKGVELVAAERGKLAKERDDVVGSLNQVAKKVEVLMPATIDPKTHIAILDAVDRLVKEKFVNELQDERAKVNKLNASLAERHSPQQMLDFWLPALQDRTQTNLAAPAQQDVRRVLNDPASRPVDRGKALFVEALALRDTGKATEARSKIAEALKTHPPQPTPWWTAAERLQAELTDPSAYYVPTIRTLATQRKSAEAQNLLNQALALFPNERGKLLVVRGELRLDEAEDRAGGRVLAANSPAVAAVRSDAEEAGKAGARAESEFLLGRLAEALNNLADAQAHYRKALELHPANDDAGDRYRLAVARALWKANQGRPAALPTAPARLGMLGPTEALALLLVFVQQEAPLPGINSDVREASELAKQVQGSRAAQKDFAMQAQALAIQGLWNEALRVFLEGIRPQLRREDAETLSMLILNHPSFRNIPDVAVIPDPQAAEAHYANGLIAFYNSKLDTAQKEFLAAVKFDRLDARYFYFLGLTRWLLEADKGAALMAFQEGARLEKQNRPGREAVNESLERVQGGLRRVLDRYRP